MRGALAASPTHLCARSWLSSSSSGTSRPQPGQVHLATGAAASTAPTGGSPEKWASACAASRSRATCSPHMGQAPDSMSAQSCAVVWAPCSWPTGATLASTRPWHSNVRALCRCRDRVAREQAVVLLSAPAATGRQHSASVNYDVQRYLRCAARRSAGGLSSRPCGLLLCIVAPPWPHTVCFLRCLPLWCAGRKQTVHIHPPPANSTSKQTYCRPRRLVEQHRAQHCQQRRD